MPFSNRLSLVASIALMLLYVFVLTRVGVVSLQKLHIDPDTAWKLMLAIIIGGLINIPVKRIVREAPVWSHPLTVFGLAETFPSWLMQRSETVIAVNLGGCIIPVGIAIYQLTFLVPLGAAMIWAVTLAIMINCLVCFAFATPVERVGIVMPGFVAPITAVILALSLTPSQAAPVAFVVGVMGTLIGADFLNIKTFTRSSVGIASIGGAGTFDGIVLSGMFAAFLA